MRNGEASASRRSSRLTRSITPSGRIPSCGPGELYDHTTIYRFDVK